MTKSIRAVAVMLGIAAASLFAIPLASAEERQQPQASQPTDQDKVQGVKSKVVVKAVRVVAKLIRTRHDDFFKLCQRFGTDGVALAVFKRNAGKIADVLDDIADIPDLAMKVVGEKLYFILTSDRGPFNLSGGTANVIKDVLMGAISAAL